MGLDTRKFSAGLKTVRGELSGFSHSVGGLALGLAAIGTVGAVALGKVLASGAALGEQTARTRVQFGDFSDEIIKQSKLMAVAFGVDQKEFLRFNSVFSAMVEGAGYAGDAAAKLSLHMVKLGIDLSSFAHLPVDEAIHKLQSGIAGMVRPLREVGVPLSEAGVNAWAAAHEIHALSGELTEGQKITARIGFITEFLAKAQGDLARTADAAGNSIRALSGRFENLKENIGNSLLVLAGPVIGELELAIQGLQNSWNQTGLATLDASGRSITGIESQIQAIGPLQTVIGKIADAWQIVGMVFKGIQVNILTELTVLVGGINFAIQGFDRLQNKLTGKHIPGIDELNAM